VPVVQLAHPGKLFGRMVERRGECDPSRISRERLGRRPDEASGVTMSNVAPSSPMITVLIFESVSESRSDPATPTACCVLPSLLERLWVLVEGDLRSAV
jgi:hypothetical protein